MRHNEEWGGVYEELSVDEYMEAIQNGSWFHP